MLETLFLIGLITGIAANITVAVYIAYLMFKEIRDWFRHRSSIKQEDKDNIAFTLQEKLNSGEYKTVQGIFNTNENELKEGRVMTSQRIDSDLRDLHQQEALVLYQ